MFTWIYWHINNILIYLIVSYANNETVEATLIKHSIRSTVLAMGITASTGVRARYLENIYTLGCMDNLYNQMWNTVWLLSISTRMDVDYHNRIVYGKCRIYATVGPWLSYRAATLQAKWFISIRCKSIRCKTALS